MLTTIQGSPRLLIHLSSIFIGTQYYNIPLRHMTRDMFLPHSHLIHSTYCGKIVFFDLIRSFHYCFFSFSEFRSNVIMKISSVLGLRSKKSRQDVSFQGEHR